jgi:hypothetical protein
MPLRPRGRTGAAGVPVFEMKAGVPEDSTHRANPRADFPMLQQKTPDSMGCTGLAGHSPDSAGGAQMENGK